MSEHSPATAYIGLGANLGDRRAALRNALKHLQALPHTSPDDEGLSSIYETQAWDVPDAQPPYLNAVVRVHTQLFPQDLMTALLEIERAMGRLRTGRGAPRNIDLDLLLYNDVVLDTPDLVLPHPRLHERRFVLEPLAEIAPAINHPRLRRTVAELAADLANTGRGGRVNKIGAARTIRVE